MKKRVHILLFLFLGMLLGSLPLLGQTPVGTIKASVTGVTNWEANLSIEAEGAFSIEGAEGNPQGNKKLSGIFKIPGESFTIRGNITSLTCSGNYLTILEIKDCPALAKLDCSGNGLKTLDVSGCTALRELNCSENELETLDVSGCTALRVLNCTRALLETLDVTWNIALTKLDCSVNQLTTLKLGSANTALKELDCSYNKLKDLDVSHQDELETLDCSYNQLEYAPGVSGLKKLVGVNCTANQLTELVLRENNLLDYLICTSNKLEQIELTGCTSLKDFQIAGNEGTLKSLILSGCTFEKLDVSNATILETLSLSECTALKDLTLPPSSNNKLMFLAVQDVALDYLDCDKFGSLLALEVKNCPQMYGISCKQANLINLSVENCPSLEWIDCSYNNLNEGLKLFEKNLVELDCSNNQLEYIVLYPLENLGKLNCSNNKLVQLDLSRSESLTKLDCSNNQLKKLEPCKALTEIQCNNNKLEYLDLSRCPDLSKLYCYRNQIKDEYMTYLVNSLPDRKNDDEWKEWLFVVVEDPQPYGNRCLRSDVLLASEKKWSVKSRTFRYGSVENVSYGGIVPFTLTKKGEGTLTATGADDLNAVEYGTRLTIKAWPAEGYNLVALTANGRDILSDPNFELREATEVKAVFAKICAVTFTKEGEGTLNATGADNLNAVNAGTELTVEATPAEGYYLTALTANGVDILATKKFVIEDATEVRATFAKKTFTVTLTKETGEGTLNATGADNLNAVEYGTELTIEATPAEGYTLVALTANGTDILATKKVVVKEATEVKATFAKKTFAVKLTKEGEGTLNATGVDNLNAVAYGTELTIEATPATGYELTALTANGADILATKKVVVKEATEVKATFAKKTFAVTLTKEAGEGTLKANGADNLNAVEYGTELTIEATPAEGYELTALTANGTDILATKKFVVKGATEIKATFTKKTAADRVEAGSVRIYPNPASAYVNVRAAKADALVRLYDANGTLLYEARTDDHGILQIELSAYAEGTYLLLVDGNAQHLLIQR